MATLKGSVDRQKAVFTGVLDRMEAKKGKSSEEKRAIEDAYELWVNFSKTKEGSAIIQLADSMIEHLESSLGKSVTHYPTSMDLAAIHEYRAELRGELRVWKSIKYTPQELKRKMEDIRESETNEGGDGEVKAEVPESVKKHLTV